MNTPYYIVYEQRIKHNLDIIADVSRRADVKIIMAFKANALWKTFDIFRNYGIESTASSLNEMQLANEELGKLAHSYCPAYTDHTIAHYMKGSSHITFNSIAQFERFKERIHDFASQPGGHSISCGFRINPMCSVVETDIYNPCGKGSRFGITAENMPETLPPGIEGFHFHALCESDSHDLEKVLEAVESRFGKYLSRLKWLNMGGGHLMTRNGYDIEHLISLMHRLHRQYPNLQIILEPGSAFTWRTGDLVASVVDVVENSGISTIIADVSFACHMPDCLEMPYKPTISEALPDGCESPFSYRIGGNSCLSGDFVGDWAFDHEIKAGERLTFEDMNHYTTVKTNMFNGIQHPAIVYQRINGSLEILREFNFDDYKHRMD